MMKHEYQYEEADNVHRAMKNFAPVELIDVRSEGEYDDGHARGAKSIPLDKLDMDMLNKVVGAKRLQARTLYLLCQSGARAEQAAHRLQQMGLQKLALVKGGTDAWRSANLPMVRTSKLPSLERQTQIALGGLLLLILFKGWVLHPAFYVLIALLGIGLITAGVTARCGLTAILARMPWNQRHGSSTA